MRKFIFSIIINVILIPLVCSCHRGTFVNVGDMSYRIYDSKDSLFVELRNETSKPIYLFSTYFDYIPNTSTNGGKVTSSIYLHRYDSVTDRYKLSFLPMAPFLSYGETVGGIVIHSDKIVMKYKTGYKYRILPPGKKTKIGIYFPDVLMKEYVRDMPMRDYSYFDRLTFDSIQGYPADTVFLEFGYYDCPVVEKFRQDLPPEDVLGMKYEFGSLTIPVPINHYSPEKAIRKTTAPIHFKKGTPVFCKPK